MKGKAMEIARRDTNRSRTLATSDKSEITDRFSREGRVGVEINSSFNRDITTAGINNFSSGRTLVSDIRKLAYANGESHDDELHGRRGHIA